VAAAFAQALGLDPLLAKSVALLHDMCRQEKRHRQAAARELRALHLPRLAALVEEHMDCTLADGAPFTEKELVYLADKYVCGDRLVTVPERFASKMDMYAGDSKALAAIEARLARAGHLERRLARELGLPPYELAGRALLTP
jgi:HD superfamily phosphodiesterase